MCYNLNCAVNCKFSKFTQVQRRNVTWFTWMKDEKKKNSPSKDHWVVINFCALSSVPIYSQWVKFLLRLHFFCSSFCFFLVRHHKIVSYKMLANHEIVKQKSTTMFIFIFLVYSHRSESIYSEIVKIRIVVYIVMKIN